MRCTFRRDELGMGYTRHNADILASPQALVSDVPRTAAQRAPIALAAALGAAQGLLCEALATHRLSRSVHVAESSRIERACGPARSDGEQSHPQEEERKHDFDSDRSHSPARLGEGGR